MSSAHQDPIVPRRQDRGVTPPEPVAIGGGLGPENPEPAAARTFRTPIWLVGLLGLMIYWGQLYFDEYGGEFQPLVYNRGERIEDVDARVPKSEGDELAVLGKKNYGLYCAVCHQPNGRGSPDGRFPPLAESDWVQAEGPNRIIRIVLNGFNGPVTVKGTEYNNVMVPWRDMMTNDVDIAAVLTFVRGNKEWGNNAAPVTPSQVKAIRDATQGRGTMTPWTAAELQAVPPAN